MPISTPTATNKKANQLIDQNSPYLLQHAYNPVNWYPWCREAFERARNEDKPIFLSIGYSTCHWCHVMEAESFENERVAEALNRNFISIKVDKEERPDIDNIYMRVCQAFTGSGGWPTSVFLTPDKKPFFAGTYIPRKGFLQLLDRISDKWSYNKEDLIQSSNQITESLENNGDLKTSGETPFDAALEMYEQSFDREYGGFGNAPKFPVPHNLMFLLYTKPDMAKKTLLQMYKGGIFDHIGYGFCRYSTDRYWLAPHFEKMLYDNALLTISYLMAYEETGDELYKVIAVKVMDFVERELTDRAGGFYCAQDADSDGVEGKYYLFTADEIIRVLGEEDGKVFNEYFNITPKGNFEGKNIPNLIIKTENENEDKIEKSIDKLINRIYTYRKTRTKLHLDNKILTSWNALMVAAYAFAYRILGDERYLGHAKKAVELIESYCEKNTLYTDPTKRTSGFLDDYAFYVFALICMHQATLSDQYLNRAVALVNKAVEDFFDFEDGGFYFSGKDNEQLILKTKETYDSALPSGNSVMAYNLDRICKLTHDKHLLKVFNKQKEFMDAKSNLYPMAYGFYLFSCLPTKDIVCVPNGNDDANANMNGKIRTNWVFSIRKSEDFPMVNNETTFYVCEGDRCMPPRNQL